MSLPGKTIAAACTALLLASGLAACGSKGQGVKEPAQEGLALDLAGIDYNVFITRELNLAIPPDSAYYKGPPAKKGETLYGVFLQACNHGKKPMPTASQFTVVDNQGNKFHPTPLPTDDAFAYQSIRLDPHECEPQAGSVAQLGPTAGSMLLFRLPLANTENRPLLLEIAAPSQIVSPNHSKLTFTLDI